MSSELLVGNPKNSSDFIKNYGALGAFVILVLKAPLIEEVLFRSWVIPSKLNIFSSILIFSYFLIVYLFNEKIHNNIILVNIWLVINGLFISSFLDREMCSRACNYSNIFIIISGIIFGVSHLINFDLSKCQWYICVPYIFPQIFSGIIFGIVRYKYGFWYVVAVHSMINLTSFLAGFF
ncbi:type II CAAX prenyl endopeptidase Rce1 family protein [Larkinella sp. VNQ87]|uniref:CPBP family glutamic-type intramembrane protease n=1 Tax=Larkinella sp. VNQ87 TaxID=3400921 RepID=UPI003C067032